MASNLVVVVGNDRSLHVYIYVYICPYSKMKLMHEEERTFYTCSKAVVLSCGIIPKSSL